LFKEGEDMSKFSFYGLLIAVALAVFIVPFVSKSPDGQGKDAGDKGFSEQGETIAISSFLPRYSIPGIKNKKLSTGLSGVVGVIIIFGAISFLGRLFGKDNHNKPGIMTGRSITDEQEKIRTSEFKVK
jgi:cobalt/nickel transport protein